MNEKIKKLVKRKGPLAENEVKDLLNLYGIPTTKYKVINKDSIPRCIVVEDREDRCVKCHMCTTACKLRAITID